MKFQVSVILGVVAVLFHVCYNPEFIELELWRQGVLLVFSVLVGAALGGGAFGLLTGFSIEE